MSCTGCTGVKKVVNKVSNIIEGYNNILNKDPEVEKVYEVRMNECKGCSKNITIPVAKVHVCRICGCIIEAKARVQDEHCPDVPSRW